MKWHRLVIVGVVALWQSSVAAETGDAKAAAESLFVEGRTLLEKGQYSEACAKFEASQRIDAALGTMLNLADCYEKEGKTASAWAEYREAVAVARATGAKEREELAQGRADALEARLSTLTIVVVDADDASLEVRRDGLLLDSAALSTPIPVDPGMHEITAHAPGRVPFQTQVKVRPDAHQVEVEIPAIEPAADASALDSEEPMQESGRRGSAQRTAGIVTLGAGAAGLGVGAAFGIIALNQWGRAKDECADYPYQCSSDAVDLEAAARTSGTVSTIAIIVGAVGATAGTVLWVTSPGNESKPQLGIGPGSITLKGAF